MAKSVKKLQEIINGCEWMLLEILLAGLCSFRFFCVEALDLLKLEFLS